MLTQTWICMNMQNRYFLGISLSIMFWLLLLKVLNFNQNSLTNEASKPSEVLSIPYIWQLSVLTGVRYLQTALENVWRGGDPECESEGWLLETSFVETARTNFNIIKNLGKFNQINTASNGDPNIDRPSTAHYGQDNVPPKSIPLAS